MLFQTSLVPLCEFVVKLTNNAGRYSVLVYRRLRSVKGGISHSVGPTPLLVGVPVPRIGTSPYSKNKSFWKAANAPRERRRINRLCSCPRGGFWKTAAPPRALLQGKPAVHPYPSRCTLR